MTWRPILEGADADAARAVIHEVADDLATRELPEPGLIHGAAGVALLHGYLARCGDAGAADRARAALARALASIDDGPFAPWLGDGFIGTAWVMHHLRDVIDGDADTLAQIDEIVGDLVARPALPFACELWAGLVGLGVYALERGRLDLVEQVVGHLERRAVLEGELVTWRRTDRAEAPDGYVDLGMAHGTSGVAAFLVAAGEAGSTGARALAADAVRGLIAYERDGAMPRFPMAIDLDVAAADVRNGWCYGDAPIAAMLRRAGALCGEPTWIDRADRLARAVADAPADHAPDYDAAFCHGAAGRAHMLNRLAHASGDARVLEAARTYARAALASRLTDRTLATGTAGVALVLASAISKVEPTWDRLFLLAS